MKWWILGTVVILFLPFYVYVLSKSAYMGKVMAIKQLLQLFKEAKDGKKDESEKK